MSDEFNMSMRKFLKQVGVTSQQEIERIARETDLSGQSRLKVKVVLTAEGTALNHTVEQGSLLGFLPLQGTLALLLQIPQFTVPADRIVNQRSGPPPPRQLRDDERHRQ